MILYEELNAGKQNQLNKIRARYSKHVAKPVKQPVILEPGKAVAKNEPTATTTDKAHHHEGSHDSEEDEEECESGSGSEEEVDEDGFTVMKK